MIGAIVSEKHKVSGRVAHMLSAIVFTFLVLLAAPRASEAQKQTDQQTNCSVPLVAAIENRDVHAVRRLLQIRADLNNDSCGVTALTESIQTGQYDVAADLIRAGADVSVPDIRHVTPLMYAAFSCRADLVSLMLDRKPNVNALNADGETALMQAALNCDDGSVVAQLLRAGADVNVRDPQGDSALTIAAWNGDEFAVKELVAAGADLNQKNGEGKTALMLSHDRQVGRKPSHDKIYDFLRQLTNGSS